MVPADREVWLRLRSELWSHHPAAELAREVDRYLGGEGFLEVDGRPVPSTVLLAEGDDARILGFAEVNLRPFADGCRTGPVGYLEGWYVVPEARRRGVGAALVAAAEEWARNQGCAEFASDTRVENDLGERSHRALGFLEVRRTIHYRKSLR